MNHAGRWERSITMRLGRDAEGIDRLLEHPETRKAIKAMVYPDLYWTPRLTRTDVVRWLVRRELVHGRAPAAPPDASSSARKTAKKGGRP